MNKNQEIFLLELEQMLIQDLISYEEYALLRRKYLGEIERKSKLLDDLIDSKKSKSLEEVKAEVKKEEVANQKPKKKELNLTALFVIGTSLLILSAIILITSTWNMVSDLSKVIFMGCFDLVFFGLSFIVDKFLKLKKAAFAYWNLGVLFIPIIMIAIGIFELLGPRTNDEDLFLHVALSLTLILPVLIYTIHRFKSQFYTVASVIDFMAIIILLSKYFALAIETSYLICSIAILGIVFASFKLFKTRNKLTKTYDILSEVLLYLVVFLTTFYTYTYTTFAIYTISIIISVVFYFNFKHFRFLIGAVLLGYLGLSSLYSSINHSLSVGSVSYPLLIIVITSLMMVVSLVFSKKSFFKLGHIVNVIVAFFLLLFVSTYGKSLYTSISLYLILAIIVVYIFISRQESILRKFAIASVFPVLMIANMTIFAVVNEYGSTKLLYDYRGPYHFFLSAVITLIVYSLCEFKDRIVFYFVSIFNVSILLSTILFISSKVEATYGFSLSSHIITYVISFTLAGLLVYRFIQNKTILVTYSFILIFATLVHALNFFKNLFEIANSNFYFVCLFLSLAVSIIGYLKTKLKKAFVYTGLFTTLFASYFMVALSITVEGTISYLLIYIITILITHINLKNIGNKKLSIIYFCFVYLVTLVNKSFYENSVTLYYVIGGALFYIFNLSNLPKSIRINKKYFELKRYENNITNYMSYGILVILIIKSLGKSNTYLEMTFVSMLVPLTIFLLAFNENKKEYRITYTSLAIFSFLMPYWYFINVIDISSKFMLAFWLIPLSIVGVIIYYKSINDLENKKFILSPFIVLPVLVLLIQYRTSGYIGNGLVLIALTISLIVFGFLIQNIVLYFTGIVGLILNLFIIIHYLWNGSPWWFYLLVSGLIVVFIASFNEYSKMKLKNNKEEIAITEINGS